MNKDELLEKAKETIEAEEGKLEQLKKKSEHASNELVAEIQNMIDDLEQKTEKAKASLAEMADAADDQWDDLKESMEKGWEETKNMFDTGWDNLTGSLQAFLSENTKEEFLQKARDTLDAQQEKLGQLKQQLEEGAEDIAEDIQGKIDSLEPQIDKTKAKIEEISDIADHRWDYMKSSAEKWWDETNKVIDDEWESLSNAVKKLFS